MSLFSRLLPRSMPIRLALILLPAVLQPGCSEIVTEGVITDRETGSPVPDVSIQSQKSGEWKQLGKTDSAGKYWLFKEKVSTAGRIRLNKSGYHILMMPDSEFMGTSAHVLIPTGHGSEDMETRRRDSIDDDSPR